METYRKVFIKTEADLPEWNKHYIVHYRGNEEHMVDSLYLLKDDIYYWVKNIDWYLQPVTAKTEQEKGIKISNVNWGIISDDIEKLIKKYKPTPYGVLALTNEIIKYLESKINPYEKKLFK